MKLRCSRAALHPPGAQWGAAPPQKLGLPCFASGLRLFPTATQRETFRFGRKIGGFVGLRHRTVNVSQCTSQRSWRARGTPRASSGCASHQPFEPIESHWKTSFTRGLLPRLPLLTRYFACLHNHFYFSLVLITLCHFSPGGWWEGAPGHPREVSVPLLPTPPQDHAWSSAQSLAAPEPPPCSLPAARSLQPSVALGQNRAFYLKQDHYILVLSWASRPESKTRGFTDTVYLASSEPKRAQAL